MHTFLTPDPITIEVRNSSGEVRLDLADVTTTTVEVTASASHPFGFLDDVFRAVAGGRQSNGARRGFDVRSAEDQDDYHRYEADQDDIDPAERVLVDLRETTGEGRGGTLIVDTDRARQGWRSSFAVHITAPTGSGVRVQTQSADVILTGVADRLETRTASGDVSIDRVLGRSVVQTASGDVTISETGDCDVRTASGDIDLRRTTADALLHSTSGDIRVNNPTGNTSARTVSGDIRLVDAVAGQAEAIAVSGDVEIGIHAGSLASVELNTISGNTDTDFAVSDQAPEDDAPVLDIRVKTTSGNIRLRRAVGV